MHSRFVEQCFLAVALLFGFVFIALTPPFQAPDEWNHFFRAYHISEGNIFAQRDASGRVGDALPVSLIITTVSVFYNIPFSSENAERLNQALTKGEGLDTDLNPFSDDKKLEKRDTIVSLFRIPLEPSRRAFVYFPGTAIYSPLAYIPQAVGIAVGRLFNMSPIGLLYMGRLVNLLVWAGLIFWALKIIPIQRATMAIVALLPASLFLAGSLSVDAVTNGVAFLLAGAIFRLAFAEDKKVIGDKEIAFLFLLSVLISLMKAYLIISCLFLLIPVERIGTRKRYFALFGSLFAVSASAIVGWTMIARDLYSPLKEVSNPPAQMSYLLTHPFGFLKTVIVSGIPFGDRYVMQFIGGLGHYGLFISPIAVYAMLIILVYSAGAEDSAVRISARQRGLLGGVVALSVLNVSALIYMTWNAVGSETIEGYQGRYLYPLIPYLLAMLLSVLPKPFKIDFVSPERILKFISPLMLAYACLTILRGYY